MKKTTIKEVCLGQIREGLWDMSGKSSWTNCGTTLRQVLQKLWGNHQKILSQVRNVLWDKSRKNSETNSKDSGTNPWQIREIIWANLGRTNLKRILDQIREKLWDKSEKASETNSGEVQGQIQECAKSKFKKKSKKKIRDEPRDKSRKFWTIIEWKRSIYQHCL